MLDRLDASVVDEADPTSVEPAPRHVRPRERLPADGVGPVALPAGVRRRGARRAARALRAARRAGARLVRGGRVLPRRLRAEGERLPAAERTLLARRALQRRYMLIYRTLADPRALDPTLDPSERPLGSIFSFGRDPVFGNYGEGIGRVMSARGWLSTWSGLSSNAALERTLPEVRVPTLVVNALADTDIYPPRRGARSPRARRRTRRWSSSRAPTTTSGRGAAGRPAIPARAWRASTSSRGCGSAGPHEHARHDARSLGDADHRRRLVRGRRPASRISSRGRAARWRPACPCCRS